MIIALAKLCQAASQALIIFRFAVTFSNAYRLTYLSEVVEASSRYAYLCLCILSLGLRKRMLMQQALVPQAMKLRKKTDTILVVEDDRGTGEMVKDIFSSETSYLTLIVTTGFEALQMVKHIKPTLFLLDYHLATMTGIELYNILHDTEGLEHIPAIILTAEISEKSRNDIKEHQLVIIQKPFDVDEFLQVIENVLI